MSLMKNQFTKALLPSLSHSFISADYADYTDFLSAEDKTLVLLSFPVPFIHPSQSSVPLGTHPIHPFFSLPSFPSVKKPESYLTI